MRQRLAEAWRMFRPRTLAQARKDVGDLRAEVGRLRQELRDVGTALKDLRARDTLVLERLERDVAPTQQRVLGTLDDLRVDLARVALGESQLRAIVRRDAALEGASARLPAVLQTGAVRVHVERRIAAATLDGHPFPHAVIDGVLPDALYQALIDGLPPLELFQDRRPNKQHVSVPIALGPSYARRVWAYMAETVAAEIVAPAVISKFRPVLTRWLSQSFPALGDDPVTRVRMHASGGRILLRTRGYVIRPHRDPKWGFLTCLLYLARPGDSTSWGTQLYAVDGDEEARGTMANWIEDARCRQVSDVTFVPNRMLVFVNTAGAHGARIPEDAPEALERYAYQFRIGPLTEDAERLVAALPDDRRALWAGKLVDY